MSIFSPSFLIDSPKKTLIVSQVKRNGGSIELGDESGGSAGHDGGDGLLMAITVFH